MKKTLMCIVMVMVFISFCGCAERTHIVNTTDNTIFLYESIPVQKGVLEVIDELREQEDYAAVEEINKKLQAINAQESMRLIGKRNKEIAETTGLDIPAVRVNGYEITKKDIEFWKANISGRVNCIMFPENAEVYLKAEIIEKVRRRVVLVEAERNQVLPNEKDINEFVREQKGMSKNEEAAKELKNYMESSGVTEEEYWENVKRNAFTTIQWSMLYDSVMTPLEEDVNIEAGERGAIVADVRTEYWERYVDELVSKAEIEIIDPELKALFGIAE